ncbi:MAG: hypothetical protein R3D68_06110 [Hyphomicrobiaceae bacterium]
MTKRRSPLGGDRGGLASLDGAPGTGPAQHTTAEYCDIVDLAAASARDDSFGT